jgi:hypothetical protein
MPHVDPTLDERPRESTLIVEILQFGISKDEIEGPL